MKRFFTTLSLSLCISYATQRPYNAFQHNEQIYILDSERLHYVVEFHRKAKVLLKQANISMDELQEVIRRREESGLNSERDIITHIVLYYTMLEIENETGESSDSPIEN